MKNSLWTENNVNTTINLSIWPMIFPDIFYRSFKPEMENAALFFPFDSIQNEYSNMSYQNHILTIII